MNDLKGCAHEYLLSCTGICRICLLPHSLLLHLLTFTKGLLPTGAVSLACIDCVRSSTGWVVGSICGSWAVGHLGSSSIRL